MIPRTFVVPLDGSEFAERALPVAQALAERFGGRLLLLTTRWDGDARGPQEYLERVAAGQGPVPTDLVLVHDRPAPTAIEVVAETDAGRVVCMTSHGRGRLRWAMLGSVAEEVVRTARGPVVLVGRHCAADWPMDFRHLMVCIDGSTVADAIVPVAAEWAKELTLDVRVAQVVHPLDPEEASRPPKALEAIVARFQADTIDADAVVMRSTYIPGALADYASELPASLMMMTSHTRSGLARVALGSVAIGTLALSPCPIVITRTRDADA